MFWPKNKIRYENLKSSFVNLKFLVEELSKSEFSGFLEVKFGRETYYILMEQGAPIRIYLKNSTGEFSFESMSVDEIYQKSLGDVASINVYDVEPEKIELLISYLNAVPLYTNLSSEFTDFERLIIKLSKDKLNGYLEVNFMDALLESSYLLYHQGEIQDVFKGEQSLGRDDQNIRDIKQELDAHEAQFNVFQSSKETVEKQADIPEGKAEDKEKIITEIPGVETTESAAKEEREQEKTKVEEVEELEEDQEELEEIEEIEEIKIEAESRPIESGMKTKPQTESQPKPQSQPDEMTEGETRKVPMPKAKVVAPEPRVERLEDLKIIPYLGFAAALIQWVEKSVDRYMGANYFSKSFKKGMLNISDKYPFLDPFLAEFTYANGSIHFAEDDTKAVEFLKGIYAAIDMIFEELSEKKRKEVKKSLKANLRDLEKRFHEEIEILRVRTLMPLLFH